MTFAGVLFFIVGSFNIIDGLVALLNAGYFTDNLLFSNLTTWGWTVLGMGAAQLLAGIAILGRSRVGQVLGIALASLNAIVQLAYLRHFPAWSIIIMAVDVIVIYALTIHDSEFA
ncbi:MAG TPA: hypothetical protein VKG89_09050 [Solirubrobacterales bacterium]|nr:hypothetical protein [Solirubrobacterales bacterium]